MELLNVKFLDVVRDAVGVVVEKLFVVVGVSVEIAVEGVGPVVVITEEVVIRVGVLMVVPVGVDGIGVLVPV